MFYRTRMFLEAMRTPFKKRYVANKCGHTTTKRGIMKYFDQKTVMDMPLEENGNPDYCLDCIGKMSIRCAWCGEPILIGERITLYIPKKDFDPPEYAVKYGDEGKEPSLVGCLKMSCCDSGADVCGFWKPPGEVHRLPSMIELISQNPEAKCISVGDTSKYPQTVQFHY